MASDAIIPGYVGGRPPAALVAAYDFERELGRGGMAVVYAARARATGAVVAVKLIPPALAVAVGVERFRQEIRIASSLDHPHILGVLDSGEADGELYLVMPLAAGGSLRNRLDREGQLPVDEAVRITRELAAALHHAHGRGVVHRDVKPENVLLDDGRALLADFGIARASADLRATQTLTATGISVGTPAYMSPEQATAERTLDGKSDQYSLACVLYEMLAGHAPFSAGTLQAMIARHLLEPPPPIAVVRSTVPRAVEAALSRALAKSPADRFPTAAAFADALGTPEEWATSGPARARAAGGGRRRAIGRRALAGAAAAAAVAAAAAGVRAWRAGRAAAAPAVTVAVAPFNPLRPEFAVWQEGMVDVLARSLDGAGPVRAVAPAVAVRGWAGRKADRASARALARRTGAQYAVYGSVNAAPGSAVQLRASLLDVRSDSLWEQAWTGPEVQALADSATLFVLARLGERHAIGAVRQAAFSLTSSDALKPFLQGEQHFRRTEWGPAMEAYQRAAALDPAAALPLRRIALIHGLQHDNADTLYRRYSLRAGELNRGLAPRDSLLVAVDSLFASLSQRDERPTDWAALRRLFATADDAARRYPRDPEVWFRVGEIRQHLGYGRAVDVTDEDVFAAFERAIALDPGFAPSYTHAVELAFQLRGRDAGRRYAAAYLALEPAGATADAVRLIARVTDPARAGAAATARLLDSVPSEVLANALYGLRRWPDSAETAVALVRAVARRPSDTPSAAADAALVQRFLPLELAYRGRLRDAYEALGNRRSLLFAELVHLGGIERDSADAVFARWLADGAPHARHALPYWAERRDTNAIRRFQARADAALAAAPPVERPTRAHDVRAARAYLRLAGGDTAAAIRDFATLADTLCLACYTDRLTEARLLAARGQLDRADLLLRQRLYTALTPAEVLIAFERGRVAVRRNDPRTAVRAFTLVADAWRGGDPEVQPMVDSARAALRALGAAGGGTGAVVPARAPAGR
jgi:serine/threonine-protein kinase